MAISKYPGSTVTCTFNYKWTGPTTNAIFRVIIGHQPGGDTAPSAFVAAPDWMSTFDSTTISILAGTSVTKTQVLTLTLPTNIPIHADTSYDIRCHVLKAADMTIFKNPSGNETDVFYRGAINIVQSLVEDLVVTFV